MRLIPRSIIGGIIPFLTSCGGGLAGLLAVAFAFVAPIAVPQLIGVAGHIPVANANWLKDTDPAKAGFQTNNEDIKLNLVQNSTIDPGNNDWNNDYFSTEVEFTIASANCNIEGCPEPNSGVVLNGSSLAATDNSTISNTTIVDSSQTVFTGYFEGTRKLILTTENTPTAETHTLYRVQRPNFDIKQGTWVNPHNIYQQIKFDTVNDTFPSDSVTFQGCEISEINENNSLTGSYISKDIELDETEKEDSFDLITNLSINSSTSSNGFKSYNGKFLSLSSIRLVSTSGNVLYLERKKQELGCFAPPSASTKKAELTTDPQTVTSETQFELLPTVYLPNLCDTIDKSTAQIQFNEESQTFDIALSSTRDESHSECVEGRFNWQGEFSVRNLTTGSYSVNISLDNTPLESPFFFEVL